MGELIEFLISTFSDVAEPLKYLNTYEQRAESEDNLHSILIWSERCEPKGSGRRPAKRTDGGTYRSTTPVNRMAT